MKGRASADLVYYSGHGRARASSWDEHQPWRRGVEAGAEGREAAPPLRVTSTTSVVAALSSLRLPGSVSPHKGSPHSWGLLILTPLSPPAHPCTSAGFIHFSFVLLNLRVKISPYKSLFFLPPRCICSTDTLPLMKRVKDSCFSFHTAIQSPGWSLGMCETEDTKREQSLEKRVDSDQWKLDKTKNLTSPKLFQLAGSPKLWFQWWWNACGSR